MCGIVGGVLRGGSIQPVLMHGLTHMEYRGYDSAGVAIMTARGIQRAVTTARVSKLRHAAAALDGASGIGHTRWATHGAPTEANAHPLRAGRVFVAHNGIIENHAELRRELEAAGRVFASDTDSEVIAHLLDIALAQSGDLAAAWQSARRRLRGAYALCALCDCGGGEGEGEGQILGAREGAPLLAAQGEDGVYLASDVVALLEAAQQVQYLENGDYVLLRQDGIKRFNAADEPLPLAMSPFNMRSLEVQLGEYTHFMQKEIFEQPDAVAATMQRFAGGARVAVNRFGAGAAKLFRRAREVNIVACGTSYHAGLIAAYWMENLGIPCRVEIASEYRYRRHPLARESLFVAVSQSGETADTLFALRAAKEAGAATMAVVNVETSSMVRESDFVFCTRAGAEIGVASTKAFTAQLTALLLLVLGIAQKRDLLTAAAEENILQRLRRLPYFMQKALLLESRVRGWGEQLASAKSALYIGRGAHYPLALEGALKIKEISYIHAEGCAAGELKHGMLALVDAELPVIGFAPDDALLPKNIANLTEVTTRGGMLYVLAGRKFQMAGIDEERIIRVEEDGGEYLSPLVYAVLLQLLAYDTARQKGTDIDKPRNLAKAVTVE